MGQNKAAKLRSAPDPNGISVDGNNIEPVENFIILAVCSHPMDTALKTLNVVLDLPLLLWPRLIKSGKISVSRLPLNCGCTYQVLSVLIYAAETWTPLAADMKALEAFHMKCQRQIL